MPVPDMRALGRLGCPPERPGRSRRRITRRRDRVGYAARRRPLLPRWLALALVGPLLGVLWVGLAASRSEPRASVATLPAAPSGDVPARPQSGTDRASRDAPPPPTATGRTFAAVDDLPLVLPHAQAGLVAFHEASQPAALPLDPVGRLLANDNPTKFTPGPDSPGPGYHVLSTRGRPRPATSAVDVVLPPGALVVAPVTGTVVEVRDYALYGSVRDWRVVVEPEARPDLHVVLVHLRRPQVAVGDRVEAGLTPLAVVRQLPFASHVDYVTNDEAPHVHLEAKAAVKPEPLDPNAPALEPTEDEDLEGTFPRAAGRDR